MISNALFPLIMTLCNDYINSWPWHFWFLFIFVVFCDNLTYSLLKISCVSTAYFRNYTFQEYLFLGRRRSMNFHTALSWSKYTVLQWECVNRKQWWPSQQHGLHLHADLLPGLRVPAFPIGLEREEGREEVVLACAWNLMGGSAFQIKWSCYRKYHHICHLKCTSLIHTFPSLSFKIRHHSWRTILFSEFLMKMIWTRNMSVSCSR